jgi:peptidoglycan hydrolase CwlO-like protein
MLLVIAMPSMAQSACLDSLQRVDKNLQEQSQLIQLKYDSIYRIIAQCKTDAERLEQHEVLKKFEKKEQQLANQLRKVEQEINIEQARIDQAKREADLAQKQAAAQAKSPVALKGDLNGHPWVDLGLPSGTKWATYNVGTKSIHGVGTRIAWGETATKKTFSPNAYTINDREISSYAGDPQYDLATAQWGEGWYTPTLQQWEELIQYCDWDYVMINGINGVLFTSPKTYNTIFLPSTGYTDDETYKLKYTTYNLAYWTSTGLHTNGAHSYIANYEQGYMTTTNRYVAHCVRPVCGVASKAVSATQNVSTTIQEVADMLHGTDVVAPDTSSIVQQDTKASKTTKKIEEATKKIEETAKTIKQTANTVKKTAKTIKNLQNLFR